MPDKAKKPKLRNFDDLFTPAATLTVTDVRIDSLVHFNDHPFKLYEGERMDDLVESIKKNGVFVPISIRPNKNANNIADAYEILAGHNRVEASRLAGKEEIPAIILEDISDEDALAIVIETNLIQRSFSDMSHSEKATVIALHHSKMFSQGKRNDILEQIKLFENPHHEDAGTSSQVAKKLTSITKVGQEYGLSKDTVARYLRINKLNAPLKIMLDDGDFAFIPAVEISYLTKDEQIKLAEQLDEGFSLDIKKAALLREYSKEEKLNRDSIIHILSGKAFDKQKKSHSIKVSSEIYSRYFNSGQTAKEIEEIVDEALGRYFEMLDNK